MARPASNARKGKAKKNTDKAQNGDKDQKKTVELEKEDHVEQEDKSEHENKSGLLSECKKWFSGAKDLYQVLGLDRTASFSQSNLSTYL